MKRDTYRWGKLIHPRGWKLARPPSGKREEGQRRIMMGLRTLAAQRRVKPFTLVEIAAACECDPALIRLYERQARRHFAERAKGLDLIGLMRQVSGRVADRA